MQEPLFYTFSLERHVPPDHLLRSIDRFVDFEAVRGSGMPLFIAATNVHTGRLRIFSGDALSADAVMASAALPFMFRAVEIDSTPISPSPPRSPPGSRR